MGDLSFGAWLRQRRRELDLTQAELAARLFCAKGTVRRLEADDLRPSKQLAEQMAAVLAVPAEQRTAFIAFARTGAQDGSPVDFVRAQPAPPHPPQPAARTARLYPLPSAASPLLGRAHTVEAAIELLLDPDVRLVTLVGPPGVGKTRLALAIAREIQGCFHEGVCFAPLAPVSSAERVLPAIAQALDLLDSGRPLAAALADRLRSEEVLLVLDNLEHLLAATPEIAALLAAAPSLKLLCTSRTALRIVGEHEFFVPPLPLPDLIRLPGVDSFAQNPALALFVARAQAIHPGFAVTAENLQPLAEICHRLDGLPLAIELAATRIKLFSPAAILTRLDRRLPFLTGGHRDAPARQRTLEAAIAWSYDLLDDAERRCLARLGVFRGGWTLEAAEAICGAEIDVVDRLAALVDQSLIQSTHTEDGEVRFHILETIREFALLRLSEEADAAAVHERHARYYLDLAVTAERQLQGSGQVAWMKRLHAEGNNLRAAFAWSLAAAGDVALGLRAGAALWWFWWTDGQVGEGRQWLDGLLARSRGLAADASLGPALLGAGILAFFAGEFAEAIPHLLEARDRGARAGARITEGYAIFMLGTVQVLSGEADDGHRLLEEGSAILRSAGVRGVVAGGRHQPGAHPPLVRARRPGRSTAPRRPRDANFPAIGPTLRHRSGVQLSREMWRGSGENWAVRLPITRRRCRCSRRPGPGVRSRLCCTTWATSTLPRATRRRRPTSLPKGWNCSAPWATAWAWRSAWSGWPPPIWQMSRIGGRSRCWARSMPCWPASTFRSSPPTRPSTSAPSRSLVCAWTPQHGTQPTQWGRTPRSIS
jgi:predicted ATPase/transcriptional regulator with XRE-family HTH domain